MEYKFTPSELESINAAFSAIDWERLHSPLEELTTELNLREVSTNELSLVLGVSDRRISQLWRDGHIPEPRSDGTRHWFPLLQSVSGYIHFLKKK